MPLIEEEANQLSAGTKLRCIKPIGTKIKLGEVYTFEKLIADYIGQRLITLKEFPFISTELAWLPERFELAEQELAIDCSKGWNIRCPKCGALAYQGIGPITCSKNCN